MMYSLSATLGQEQSVNVPIATYEEGVETLTTIWYVRSFEGATPAVARVVLRDSTGRPIGSKTLLGDQDEILPLSGVCTLEVSSIKGSVVVAFATEESELPERVAPVVSAVVESDEDESESEEMTEESEDESDEGESESEESDEELAS